MFDPAVLAGPLIAFFTLIILFQARDVRGRFVGGAVGRRIDLQPQWLNIPKIAETAQGTFVQSGAIQTPVARESGLAMEVLKVQWLAGDPGTHTRDADTNMLVQGQITTRSKSGMITSFAFDVIARLEMEKHIAFAEATETGAAGYSNNNAPIDDLEAADGRGFLTVARSFYLGYKTTTISGSLSTLSARILYRTVRLSKEEMLGLLEESVE